MILLLHNRYRTTGGEERAVGDLSWLIREHLREDAELLERDSAALPSRQAAAGLLRGGLHPEDVAAAVRRTGARVVHAHNLHPAFGWRALAAAREAGARTVLHLHNYRLVCAVGTCFTDGAECTRCHGRDTLPGLLRNCRGDRSEAAVYAAGLALQQRRLVAAVDAFVVPSRHALDRLAQLGAPLGGRATVIAHPQRAFAASGSAAAGGYALVAGRLAREKGVDVAIEACTQAGVPLVVAGDGPDEERLRAMAAGRDVRFEGRVGSERLAELRRGAGVAVVPSRYAEIFGLSAAEAMAAGVPTVGSRVGSLQELLADEDLVAPGDSDALAELIRARRGDAAAGQRALDRVRELTDPGRVAAQLAEVYAGV